jgi:hypothetical protein
VSQNLLSSGIKSKLNPTHTQAFILLSALLSSRLDVQLFQSCASVQSDMRLLGTLIFVLLSSLIDGLKILAVLPGVKSQWAIGHAIVKSVVDAGHEATVVAAYRLENPIKGYREIDISSVLNVQSELFFSFSML